MSGMFTPIELEEFTRDASNWDVFECSNDDYGAYDVVASAMSERFVCD